MASNWWIFATISLAILEKNDFSWGDSKFISAQLKMINVPISAVYCEVMTVNRVLKFWTKVHPYTTVAWVKSWLLTLSYHGAIIIDLSPPTRIFHEKMKKVIFQLFKAKIFTVQIADLKFWLALQSRHCGLYVRVCFEFGICVFCSENKIVFFKPCHVFPIIEQN